MVGDIVKKGLALLLGGASLALGAMTAFKGSSKGSPAAGKLARGPAFRAALVRRALRDVDVVIEEGGINKGPVVNAYLRAVNEAPGANWCAAGLSAWLRDAAAELGAELGFRTVSGAKLLGRLAWQSRDARRVVRTEMSPETCPAGTIVVWDRATPGDESTAWRGHIGIVVRWIDRMTFETIEANGGPRGDRVARVVRRLDDPKLLEAVVL